MNLRVHTFIRIYIGWLKDKIAFFFSEFSSSSFFFQKGRIILSLQISQIKYFTNYHIVRSLYLPEFSWMDLYRHKSQMNMRSLKQESRHSISQISEVLPRFSTLLFYSHRGRFAPDLLAWTYIFELSTAEPRDKLRQKMPPCRSPTSLIGCEIILKNSIGPGGTGWSPTYYFTATDFECPVNFLRERSDISVLRTAWWFKIQLLTIYVWVSVRIIKIFFVLKSNFYLPDIFCRRVEK